MYYSQTFREEIHVSMPFSAMISFSGGGKAGGGGGGATSPVRKIISLN